MSVGQLAVTGAWAAVALLLVAFIAFVLPAIARVRYVTRLDELRDTAVDMMLDGDFPRNDPAVLEFVRIQENLRRRVREITLARAAAYMGVLRRAGVKPFSPAPRNCLTVEQRRALQELERQSKMALARYLVWGSVLGYAALGFADLRRDKHRSPVATHVKPAPTKPKADELAAETYGEVKAEVRSRHGADVAAFRGFLRGPVTVH